jgi:nudix-type nucleoside diphosphatase (YffH/AdpP family)
MPIELVDTTTVHEGWCQLLVSSFRMGDGRPLRREIEDHGRAACVLPYDPLRKTAILVRQFRAPVFVAARQAETLEAVAGIIESESAAECARREAFEEAGLKLAKLEPVVTGWTMPGISTERMDFFLAPYGAADRFAARADADEPISVVEMPLARLAEMADSGELTDVKTLLLVQTLRLRRPDLF